MVPGQVLEADLVLAVAVPLGRGEPAHGVLAGLYECGRDGDLVLGARCDVEARLPHDGHVQVVNQGHLQALRALVVVGVVEGLDVKQHRVAIVFPGFSTLKYEIAEKCI